MAQHQALAHQSLMQQGLPPTKQNMASISTIPIMNSSYGAQPYSDPNNPFGQSFDIAGHYKSDADRARKAIREFIKKENLEAITVDYASNISGKVVPFAWQVLMTMNELEQDENDVNLFIVKIKDSNSKVSLDSVIMSDEKKEEIRAAISQLKNEEVLFKDWGFSEVFEKGTAVTLLFWGIPGTGKTLMAQAIADELGADLKSYGTAEIQSAEPGGAERTMKAIFSATKKIAGKKQKRKVILFDECDSLLTDRNEVGPILGAQINTLLQEIEHFDGVIILTTNRLGKLDPALERRISAKIEFVFPDKPQREKIWERMIPKKAPLHKDVSLKKLSDYPLAGGNIKNAVLNAARFAAYKGESSITMKHFKDAIEREAKSLQAFVSEYEASSHTSSGRVARTQGGLTVGKDLKPEVKKEMAQKLSSGLSGLMDGGNTRYGK